MGTEDQLEQLFEMMVDADLKQAEREKRADG